MKKRFKKVVEWDFEKQSNQFLVAEIIIFKMEQQQTQTKEQKQEPEVIETQKPKLTKTVRAFRITFAILVISWILLLGAWLAQLIKISFN